MTDIHRIPERTAVRDKTGVPFALVVGVHEKALVIRVGRFLTMDYHISSELILRYDADEGFVELNLTEEEFYRNPPLGVRPGARKIKEE